MRPYETYRVADVIVMLAVVLAALATWAWLGDSDRVALWKPFISVGITVICALAALTRHPTRAALIRLTIGGWLIAAPYLLSFADIGAVRHAYLVIGLLVLLTSTSLYIRVGKMLATPHVLGLGWLAAPGA